MARDFVMNEALRASWMGMVVGAVLTQGASLLTRRKMATATQTFAGAAGGGVTGAVLAGQASRRSLDAVEAEMLMEER